MKKYMKTVALLLLVTLLGLGCYHGYCSIRSQKQFEALAAALAYTPHDIYISYTYTDPEESDDHVSVSRMVSLTLAPSEGASQVDGLLAQLTYEGYFPSWQSSKRVTPGEDSYSITILKAGGTISNGDEVLFDLFMTENLTVFGGDTHFFYGELGNTEALYQAVRELCLAEKVQRIN